MTKDNKRKAITKNQRIQIIGLCSIARTKGQELEAIKQSFNEILGNPHLGEDVFWDIVWDSKNVVDMIDDKEFKRKLTIKGIGS